VKTMTNRVRPAGIFLLVILLATPTLVVHSGNGGTIDDKVMLSLQIAKAKKETRKIEYYKSIARQMKQNRFFTGSHLSSAQ